MKTTTSDTILAIDTASPSPAVTVAGGTGVFDVILPQGRHASEELLSAIASCLAGAQARLTELSRIAVCSGPGSFTGVRVGLATAWGLSRALGIPAETVSTLEVLAEAARAMASPVQPSTIPVQPSTIPVQPSTIPVQPSAIAAVLDAGRGEVVWQPFELGSSRARAEAPIARVRKEEAARAFGGRPVACIPADLLGPALPSGPLSALTAPLSRALAEAVRREAGTVAHGRFAAIYSRPSAAEEKHGAA